MRALTTLVVAVVVGATFSIAGYGPSISAIGASLPLSIAIGVAGGAAFCGAQWAERVGKSLPSEFFREISTGMLAGAAVSLVFTAITADSDAELSRQQSELSEIQRVDSQILDNVRGLRQTVATSSDHHALRDFSYLHLVNAELPNLDLREANFERSVLCGADLQSADLSGASLTRVVADRALLSGATLRDADLSGAKLTDANLAGADMTHANLSGADLTGARLTYADLTDVTTDEGTHFAGVVYNSQTKWPKGFAVPPSAQDRGWSQRPCDPRGKLTTYNSWPAEPFDRPPRPASARD